MSENNLSRYKFDAPYSKGNWNIFKRATLSNLVLSDCNSSITGKCETANTLEECLELSEKSGSKAGYFIKTPDNKNICVPLVHRGEHIHGPVYRIRNKNIYPILKNMDSYVFTNKIYRFPPDLPNVLFYTDYLTITNTQTKKSIGSVENDLKETVVLGEPINLQFLPSELTRTGVDGYITIKCGDPIVINIPETSFIMRVRDNNLYWAMEASRINVTASSFNIFAIGKNKGDLLSYSDTFYFVFENLPVIIGEDGSFSVLNKNVADVIDDNTYNMKFTITPKVQVYYCDNGKCKGVSLSETERNGTTASYRGNEVHRSASCWNMCKGRFNIGLIILSVILILVVMLILIRRIRI
jgi:hypothetical protein